MENENADLNSQAEAPTQLVPQAALSNGLDVSTLGVQSFVPLMPHVAARIFNTPLLIAPSKFEVIVEALGQRVISADLIVKGELEDDNTISAASAAAVSPSDEETGRDRDYKVTQDGIAVINVRGTLMKRSSWLGAISGATSYLKIGAQIKAAVEDPSVRGVLLDINSPGGETHGCFELSDLIYSLRDKKPIHAVANDLAASAAYAIASAASKITVTRTGAVGSIGVLMCHIDQSKLDNTIGLKYTYLYRGEKKVMGNSHEPLGKDARTEIQAEIDRQYGIFTETVARNRGANVAQITRTEAGMFAADNAMPLLADAVGTRDDAMNALLAEVQKSGVRAGASAQVEQPAAEAETVSVAATAVGAAADYEMDDPPAPASPSPDDEEEEDEEDEEDDEEDEIEAVAVPKANQKENGATVMSETNNQAATTGTAAAANPAPATNPALAHNPKEIAELCAIAGPAGKDLLASFIAAETPTAEVRKQLLDLRAKANNETAISGNHGGQAKFGSLDALDSQAKAIAAKEGCTVEQGYLRACQRNPHAYDSYMEERNDAIESRSGARGYLSGLISRFPGWAAKLGANYEKLSA